MGSSVGHAAHPVCLIAMSLPTATAFSGSPTMRDARRGYAPREGGNDHPMVVEIMDGAIMYYDIQIFENDQIYLQLSTKTSK